jgi:hypothetical protein
MGTGQDFRQSDEQLIQAELAKIIKVKDGKLYIKGKLQKITLPGEPGENGVTPKKGVDYHDGEDGKTPVKGKDYRDGKDGITPKKGVDYKDGEDGYTPQKDVDYRDGKDAKPSAHRWNGTCLSFQNPDGTWGESVDLKGKPGENIKGDKGDSLEHEWSGKEKLIRFKNPDGSWDLWTNLQGEPGKPGKGIKGDKPVKGIDYEVKDGKDAVLPEAEEILILKDVNQVVGETGKVALEKQFLPIKVLKV